MLLPCLYHRHGNHQTKSPGNNDTENMFFEIMLGATTVHSKDNGIG